MSSTLEKETLEEERNVLTKGAIIKREVLFILVQLKTKDISTAKVCLSHGLGTN